MTAITTASRPDDFREFRFGISKGNKLILGSCIGFFLFLPASIATGGLLSGDTGLLGAGFVVLLLVAPMAGWLWWMGARSSMTVGREGIRFRNVLAKSLQISWDDIERLSVMPGHEGLVLKRPLELRGARRLAGSAGMRIAGASFYLPEEESTIAAQRWIPLRPFGGWLRKGPLLDALRQYAPQLAADYQAQRGESASARSQQILAWTSIAMITMVLSSFAVGMGLADDRQTQEWMNSVQEALNWIQPVVYLVGAICLVVISAANLRAAAVRIRSRSYGYALLWLAMSVVQALWALALVGQLAG